MQIAYASANYGEAMFRTTLLAAAGIVVAEKSKEGSSRRAPRPD
jgi:hypothetical protein